MKKQPYKLMLHFGLKGCIFFHVSIFLFFIPLRKKKKIKPTLTQVTLTTFSPGFSVQPASWKTTVGTAYLGVTVPLPLRISPEPKKTESSFHQIIPPRIKVLSRCKIVETGGGVAVTWAEHAPGDKGFPGSKTRCHVQASCSAILL